MALAASAALRSQLYTKMVRESGAGKVLTSIDVTIPIELEAPRNA